MPAVPTEQKKDDRPPAILLTPANEKLIERLRQRLEAFQRNRWRLRLWFCLFGLALITLVFLCVELVREMHAQGNNPDLFGLYLGIVLGVKLGLIVTASLLSPAAFRESSRMVELVVHLHDRFLAPGVGFPNGSSGLRSDDRELVERLRKNLRKNKRIDDWNRPFHAVIIVASAGLFVACVYLFLGLNELVGRWWQGQFLTYSMLGLTVGAGLGMALSFLMIRFVDGALYSVFGVARSERLLLYFCDALESSRGSGRPGDYPDDKSLPD